MLAAAGTLAFVLDRLGPPPAPQPPAVPHQAVHPAAVPPVYHGNNNAWPAPHPARSAAIPPPDPLLLEPAPDFAGMMLPRRGPDGRRPSTAYAALAGTPAMAPATSHPALPRIALVVEGIGLDHADSLTAIAALPAAVDLAVSAYATDTAALLQAARAAGHETLLSLPMEPAGYPSNDEGAHQLLTGATAAENARNLEWALSRMEGYVGVTAASDGQHGERYAASPVLMGDVKSELDRRGLIYVDPEAAVAIDPAGAPAAEDAALATLEQAAHAHGTAVGLLLSPSPMLVARVAAWAKGVADRGLTLAPITAVTP